MASRLSVDEVDDIFFCPGNIVSERFDPGVLVQGKFAPPLVRQLTVRYL